MFGMHPESVDLRRSGGWLSDRRWTAGWPLAGAAFYLVFIARSAFFAGPTVYFSLFDDAMISMRYARNLAQGHGLVWNAGQRPVEGYTNLLWTLWMAAVHLLPLPSSLTSLPVMLSAAALLFGTGLLTQLIVLELNPGRNQLAFAAALVVVLYYPLVFWSLRGMETGLLAFALTATVLVTLRLRQAVTIRRLALLALAIAVLELTRDDSLVACSIVCAFAIAFSRGRRPVVGTVLIGILTLTLVGRLGFRELYYGNLLPNTYYLKVSGIPLTARLGRGIVAFARLGAVELYMPVFFASVYFVRRRGNAIILLGSIFIGQSCYSIFVGGDAWEEFGFANRYIAEAVPLLLVMALMGIDKLIEAGAAFRRRVGVAMAVLVSAVGLVTVTHVLDVPLISISTPDPTEWISRLLVLLLAALLLRPLLQTARLDTTRTWLRAVGALMLVLGGTSIPRWAISNAEYVITYDRPHVMYGIVQAAVTSADGTIAVAGSGAAPYFSARPAIDLLGKSDSFIAHGPSRLEPFLPGHSKWSYEHSICSLRPDLVSELWQSTNADYRLINGCGYDQLPGLNVFVLRGSQRVDRPRLEVVLGRLRSRDPVVFAFLVASPH